MKRTGLVVAIVLLISIISFAQKNSSEYDHLLWRISGKDMRKPSYLYGTIHLTDKKLFSFYDSLYAALENTDGFAAELDMATMMPMFTAQINERQNKMQSIVDVIGEEWLAPHKAKLEELFGKKLKEITVKELLGEKSKWVTDLFRNGEMPTIMDMYLMDIARRQGKWIGSIEDAADQMNKNTDEREEVEAAVEEVVTGNEQKIKFIKWMIDTYLEEALSRIDLTSDLMKGADIRQLNRRNVKMARRIDSIMSIRNCLFAIGAAHIPGDSGVVKLLRERGYTVEPVQWKKRIAPGKYKYNAIDLPWVTVSPATNIYKVQMPGKPEPLNEEEGPSFYFDFSRLNAYFTFGTILPAEANLSRDSIYEALVATIASEGTVMSRKDVKVNGFNGKEYVIQNSDIKFRMQVFLQERVVVMNMVTAIKEDSMYGSDASRFFNSLSISKILPPKNPGGYRWRTFSFPQHAFSIDFFKQYTVEPQDNTKEPAWRKSMYIIADQEKFSSLVLVMESARGYYSDSDTGYFNIIRDNLLRIREAKQVVIKPVLIEGYPAADFVVSEKDGETMAMRARIINRGSRRYYLYAQFINNDTLSREADEFINSFRFLPIPAQRWDWRAAPGGDISVWSPVPVEYQGADSARDHSGYQVYDSLSPNSIIINRFPMSPYYWWKSDSSFFIDQADNYVTENDSLVQQQFFTNGPISRAEFHIKTSDNHLVKKVSMQANGDSLYVMFGFISPAELQSDNYKKMFSEIRFTRPIGGRQYLENKTRVILRDLDKGDSASFVAAGEALRTMQFTTGDLPYLQQALLHPFRDFDPDQTVTHDWLIDKIVAIDDGSTVAFIKKQYSSLTGSQQELRYPFLSVLLRLQTKESFEAARAILAERSLGPSGNPRMLYYGLTDSLSLTATILPELLAYSADDNFIHVLPSVINTLIDSGITNIRALLPYKNRFYALADREVRRLKAEPGVFDLHGNAITILLGRYKDAAGHQLMQRLLRTSVKSVQYEAALGLVRNAQPVEPAQMLRIAADDLYRIDLYTDLKRLKKENLFPAKYRTQAFLAQSILYNSITDDAEPSSIEFVMEQSASYLGKMQKFYLFKVTFEGQDSVQSFLGVVGPYKTTTAPLTATASVIGYDDSQPFDRNKIRESLKAYLAAWEKYELEREARKE